MSGTVVVLFQAWSLILKVPTLVLLQLAASPSKLNLGETCSGMHSVICRSYSDTGLGLPTDGHFKELRFSIGYHI